MNILVVNSGSSSIKASIYDAGPEFTGAAPNCLLDGGLTGIGTPTPKLELHTAEGKDISGDPAGHRGGHEVAAIQTIFDAISRPGLPGFDAIGYRVVHPGAKLDRHQRITPEILADLEGAVEFAPLHDPAVIRVIREGMRRYPKIEHYACFDTVFHHSMPEEASTYPIPEEWRAQGLRRYGFHGLSCESVVWQLRANGAATPQRMAIAHLGSGCSVTALIDGRSVDTTMGLTPTGGVVMGTRPGDLDPGLVLYLIRKQQGELAAGVSAVEAMLNKASGMVALSGLDNDMKAVRKAAAAGDAAATLALKVFTRSVAKAIGGFSWLLGGLDAVVFSGGIGEHDAATRAEVMAGAAVQGIAINPGLNDEQSSDVRSIEASQSHAAVLVVPAKEDLMIAMHVDRLARETT